MFLISLGGGDSLLSHLTDADPFAKANVLVLFTTRSKTKGSRDRIESGDHGIMSEVQRRALIRLIYHDRVPKGVRVRFVVSPPLNENDEAVIKYESRMYGDILVVNDSRSETEMDQTRVLFKSVVDGIDDGDDDDKVTSASTTPDFVLNTDMNSFVHLDNMQRTLTEHLDGRSTILGRLIRIRSSDDRYGRKDMSPTHDMSNVGYVLSWDLVHAISMDVIPDKRLPNLKSEDSDLEPVMLGEWIKQVSRIRKDKIRWVSVNQHVHDHPETGGRGSERFTPQTLIVSSCTDERHWISAAHHFYPISLLASE